MTKPLRRTRTKASGPTVMDVARAAGVSAMTVSRVVNGGPSVADETRDKVLQIIAKLGYVPNIAARALAGGRQCRIALLHSNPSSAYLSDVLVGSLDGATQCDAQIVVEAFSDTESQDALLARIVSHRIDAVLLPPPLCDNTDLIAALIKAELPYAQIATGTPHASAVSIAIDDAEATRTMTAHLITLGHVRIGFICGAPNQTASRLRRAGYQTALRDADLTVAADLIVAGDFTYRSGLEASERLLSQVPRPTAILASNDDMAAAALAVAHRHQLRVPEDLTVVGFDDSAMARTVWPELTTIRQPIAEMTCRATIALAQHAQLKGSSASNPLHETLPFELVLRASDGPPAIIPG